MASIQLKVYDATTQHRIGIQNTRISFNLVTGYININKRLVSLLQIGDKSTLSISQDMNRPADWYIYLDPKGMLVRKSTTGSMLISNKRCCADFAISIGAPDSRLLIVKVGLEPIEVQGIKMYPLITKGAIAKV